jgi:hypothetical protein
MQGTGGRRFYARLLSYSVGRNRYGHLPVLLGAITFIALLIYHLTFHRR